jgi:hypothetical protein
VKIIVGAFVIAGGIVVVAALVLGFIQIARLIFSL